MNDYKKLKHALTEDFKEDRSKDEDDLSYMLKGFGKVYKSGAVPM